MNRDFSDQLALWHQFIETQNAEILDELLADEVQFHSPFVWKPKQGKILAAKILTTAAIVFKDFKYVREILGENNWALEFEASIGQLTVRGVDLITLDESGQITDFEVMVRPANALLALGAAMTERLEAEVGA